MALTTQQQSILKGFGERIVSQLVNDIKTKKITKYGAVNASGNLADSVRYEVDEKGLRIYASDYIYYLEKGRGPTKSGGSGKLRPIIRRWIDEKGIVPNGISKDSLAFLITRKIHEEGTTIWQQGGSDLVSGIVNDDLISEVQNAMVLDIIRDIRSNILNLKVA